MALMVTVVFDNENDGERFTQSIDFGTTSFIDDFNNELSAPDRIIRVEYVTKET